MPAFTIRITLIVLSLGLLCGISRADSPPKLNVGPSCEAAARGAIAVGRDKGACMGDEHAAQDTLTENWSKYDAASKTQCVGNVLTGGPASYVELLSCLEIMRDAKAIRAGASLADTEQAAPRTGRRHR